MNKTKEEFDAFCLVMWGVAEDFGGKLSKEGLKMRFMALQEFSINQITAAGTWLLKHREKTFPAVPTTKEFIDVIQEQHTGPKVSAKSRAEIQADKVLAKLKYHGRAGKADFEDPITQTLMTIRWEYRKWASLVKETELVWWRKEFIQAYEAYDEQAAAGQVLIDGPQNDAPGQIGAGSLGRLAQKSVKRIGV